MEELVGNTQGFAESGYDTMESSIKYRLIDTTPFSVSSAIVQRYLTQIMDSVLATDPHLQGPAIDILTFTVKQGLAHPLTVLFNITCFVWRMLMWLHSTALPCHHRLGNISVGGHRSSGSSAAYHHASQTCFYAQCRFPSSMSEII